MFVCVQNCATRKYYYLNFSSKSDFCISRTVRKRDENLHFEVYLEVFTPKYHVCVLFAFLTVLKKTPALSPLPKSILHLNFRAKQTDKSMSLINIQNKHMCAA